jgi:UDP-N-acetylglucosamine 3-dehydrogenase
MEELRVGVAGVGFWGRNHARVYSALEGVKLVAVCDSSAVTASRVANTYHCRAYTDLADMLRKEKLDIASICTPSSTHAQVATELVRAGVNCLVEKPFTATIEEGKRLIDDIKKSGVYVTVGFIERFNPVVQTMKRWIDEGRLGKVTLFYSKRVSNWPDRIGDVGVVKDLSIHDLDLARYLLGSEPVQVYSLMGRAKSKTHEDFANIMLNFGSSSAFVESNWLTPYKERQMVVTGSKATGTANYLTQQATIYDAEGAFSPLFKSREPLEAELSSFVERVRSGREAQPSAEDGIKALTLAEAAIDSAKNGQPVDLSR